MPTSLRVLRTWNARQCASHDPCHGARHSTAFSTSVSFPWLRDVVEPRTQVECGFYSIRSIFEALVFWNIQLVEAGVTIPFVHVTFVTLRFHAAQLVHHGRLQQSRCRQRRRVCPPISHSRACPSSIPPTQPPPSATSPLHLRQTTPSSPASKRRGSPGVCPGEEMMFRGPTLSPSLNA
jgi:hypothetical protein